MVREILIPLVINNILITGYFLFDSVTRDGITTFTRTLFLVVNEKKTSIAKNEKKT